MENAAEMQRLARLHSALVNKRHGIITSLIEETNSMDAPGLFVFNGLTIEASYFCDNKHARRQDARNGSGAAFDRASALWASFGESLERYAAFIPDRTQIRLATESELGDAAVAPGHFILFSDSQYAQAGFPFQRPDPALPINWVGATDLSDNTEKLVPAMMVFLGFRLSHPHENLAQNTSSGLSCGASHMDAVRGGLCEVIERDAFASMWQLRYSPPRLVVSAETAEKLQPGVRMALANENVKIHLWSITADTGIPVIMAVADSLPDGRIAFGSAANPNVERAINKAVVEALHGLIWSNRVRNRGKPMPQRDEIVSPADHFAYYLEPERRHALDFLFQNAGSVDSSALKVAVEPSVPDMVAHLAALGYPTLAVDVTTDDVAGLDLNVVRTMVPGLQPLLFGGNMISLDERRLRRLATFWGIDEFPAPNPAPHPFP